MDPFLMLQFLVEWFIIYLLFVQVDFSMLFSTLSCRKIIQLFSSMLMERRIILCAHSLRWGRSGVCVHVCVCVCTCACVRVCVCVCVCVCV